MSIDNVKLWKLWIGWLVGNCICGLIMLFQIHAEAGWKPTMYEVGPPTEILDVPILFWFFAGGFLLIYLLIRSLFELFGKRFSLNDPIFQIPEDK
jgi:hypothetical protein